MIRKMQPIAVGYEGSQEGCYLGAGSRCSYVGSEGTHERAKRCRLSFYSALCGLWKDLW